MARIITTQMDAIMLEVWADDFFFRAVLAALLLSAAAAPLGCFVVWRRLAYFGDATSHASVLGVALALAFSLSIIASVLAVSAVIAVFVARTQHAGQELPSDSVLGVLSHGALATGLVLAALLGVRIDLDTFLFGDILAVNWTDILILTVGSGAILGFLIWRWQRLLMATLNEGLAIASEINVRRETLLLMLAIAVTVALAIKVVGALLITALLIIPAATARQVAKGPEMMALLAVAVATMASLAGLGASYFLDTPAGPSIVTAAMAIFLGVSGFKSIRN